MSDFQFAEDFLPVYDVSDAVAATVDADAETAWQALLEVDLLKLGREAPLVGMLGALRMLPEVVGHLLHGERPAKPPESMRLRDMPSIPMSEGGWILLSERPGTEIALGLVGKFWRPVIEWAEVRTADEFRAFEEPGFAKTVYDLSVRELGPGKTLLSGLMRTATTDEHARRSREDKISRAEQTTRTPPRRAEEKRMPTRLARQLQEPDLCPHSP